MRKEDKKETESQYVVQRWVVVGLLAHYHCFDMYAKALMFIVEVGGISSFEK